jgi:hypothetical protein
MTRLAAPVNKGDTTFTVGSGLDWKAGDRVGLTATSTAYLASDDVTITGYDNTTGVVTFD